MIDFQEAVEGLVGKDKKEPGGLDVSSKKKEVKDHLEKAMAVCDECGFDMKDMISGMETKKEGDMYSSKDEKKDYDKQDSGSEDGTEKNVKIKAAIVMARKKMK